MSVGIETFLSTALVHASFPENHELWRPCCLSRLLLRHGIQRAELQVMVCSHQGATLCFPINSGGGVILYAVQDRGLCGFGKQCIFITYTDLQASKVSSQVAFIVTWAILAAEVVSRVNSDIHKTQIQNEEYK